MSTPTANLSPGSQFATLYTTQLRLIAKTRKTLALAIVQLIPVLIAGVAVYAMDIDGSTMFRKAIENITFPFLIPLVAIAYGGSAVVDEIEGRTLTYLTLRPIPKPIVFLSKTLASATFGSVMVLVPMLVLFLMCLGGSADLAETASSLVRLSGSAVLGMFTYTAIFSMLGAFFATSLIASVLFYAIFEGVFAVLPVLEMASVRYYMRTVAGFTTAVRAGFFANIVQQKPVVLEWWAGALVAGMLTLICLGLGSYIFQERQYHV